MSTFKMNLGDIPPDQLSNTEKKYSGNDEVKPYHTSAFRKEYRKEEPVLTFPEKCKKTAGNLVNCSNKRKCLEKVLPFLRIYRKYKIRTDLPNDVIAGFTVGIMQLPQGRILFNKFQMAATKVNFIINMIFHLHAQYNKTYQDHLLFLWQLFKNIMTLLRDCSAIFCLQAWLMPCWQICLLLQDSIWRSSPFLFTFSSEHLDIYQWVGIQN